MKRYDADIQSVQLDNLPPHHFPLMREAFKGEYVKYEEAQVEFNDAEKRVCESLTELLQFRLPDYHPNYSPDFILGFNESQKENLLPALHRVASAFKESGDFQALNLYSKELIEKFSFMLMADLGELATTKVSDSISNSVLKAINLFLHKPQ